MKKKVIKLIIILMLIGAVVYFNVYKPAKIYEKTANIYICENDNETSDEEYDRELFDDLISEYNGENYDGFINDEILVRTNTELPSNKDKDYKSIYVSLKIKNRSIFLLNDINARGTTVVMATHARDIVNKMRKRVIQIEKGVIVRDDKKGGYSGEI